MNEADVFAKLRAANWTDEDLALLKHAIKYDKRIRFEEVLEMLGHFAQAHDNQKAANALQALCEFTLFMYEGIQRARFTCNNTDARIDEMVKFYTDRVRHAGEIKANLDAKFSLLKNTQACVIDAKGAVH